MIFTRAVPCRVAVPPLKFKIGPLTEVVCIPVIVIVCPLIVIPESFMEIMLGPDVRVMPAAEILRRFGPKMRVIPCVISMVRVGIAGTGDGGRGAGGGIGIPTAN